MSRPITRQESNAYLEGWRDSHRGFNQSQHPMSDAYRQAYQLGHRDCAAGKINADWALGPDKLPNGATTEEP